MADVVIIAEKPSAARNMAKALGGQRGNFDGDDYVIVNARGHLYEFVGPEKMVSGSKVAQYKSWDLAHLPWDEHDFSWQRGQRGDVDKEISNILRATQSCSEVVIGSDIDPSGEGDLLIWEIIDELDLHNKKITRMEFIDEAESSLQKAFRDRRTVISMQDEGDYRKADYRSKFDFLSMQWTRIATRVLMDTGRKAVVRNGRLKSTMVLLVGDQIKAYNNYKKKPMYMARFVDDHGVVYSNPETPEFENKNDVDLSYLAQSSVTLDSKTTKTTKPPQLLDLSSLSAMLSKQGFNAKSILDTYQKMYNDQVVSYPRTSDVTVTNEQFNELLPLVDKIAGVVGVDTSLLTHRSPRRTHVKDEGAHGANRPGTNVPASLSAVEKKYGTLGRRIYEVLAQNYLTMLAEDYKYEQHKGYVTDFPDFVGAVSVPVFQGWRDVFVQDPEVADSDDNEGVDDDSSTQGLGTTAKPEVGERINKRPPWPTMGWLMKQLKKENVGTGATRTSTFGDASSGKYALINEKSSKLTLSDVGEMGYNLLPGTHIGSIGITKKIYENMEAIAQGKLTTDDALAPVQQWIIEDIDTMRNNASTNINESIGAKFMTVERATGTWNGENVNFKRVFAGYRFTDDEVEALLNGDEITIDAKSKKGNPIKFVGKLGYGTFETDDGEEKEWFGFQGEIQSTVDPEKYATGRWEPKDRDIKFKRQWGEHKFTDEEIAKLLAGDKIEFTLDGKKVTGGLKEKSFTNAEGRTIDYVGFTADIDTTVYAVGVWKKTGKKIKFKRQWSGHKFSDQEISDLLDDKEISFEAMSKSKNKPYEAKGKLEGQTFTKNGRTINYIGFKPDFGDKK